MRIKTKKLSKWIDPELIANHFALKFGEHGLSWLDSDGKDNGEWSILGVNPKEIICSRNISNLDKDNNPFFKLKNINSCLLYTSPSPRDKRQSRMPSSA